MKEVKARIISRLAPGGRLHSPCFDPTKKSKRSEAVYPPGKRVVYAVDYVQCCNG